MTAIKVVRLLALGSLFIVNSVFAQEMDQDGTYSDPTSYSNSEQTARNFFVGVGKSFTEVELKSKGESTENDLDQSLGIFVGYADIKIQNLGYIGRVGVDFLEDDQKLYRLEGNGTYGLNSQFYIFGGINISKLSDEEVSGATMKVDPGFGFQLGAGAKFNKLIGAQFQFTKLNNDLNVEIDELEELGELEVDLSISGLEVAINIFF